MCRRRHRFTLKIWQIAAYIEAVGDLQELLEWKLHRCWSKQCVVHVSRHNLPLPTVNRECLKHHLGTKIPMVSKKLGAINKTTISRQMASAS